MTMLIFSQKVADCTSLEKFLFKFLTSEEVLSIKYIVSDFQTQVMIQTGILIFLFGVSNVTAGMYKQISCNPQKFARYSTVDIFW